MSQPLVSVGLPVRNGDEFLGAALRSLQDQDIEDLEIIVSDNGSTDATPEICREATRADPRVTYRRHDTNRGAAWNYQHVFRAAGGRYFKWAAHDDLCRPSFLRRCIEALEADASAVLAYPRTDAIGDVGAPGAPFADDLALVEDDPADRLARLFGEVADYHPIFGVIRSEVLADTGVMGGYVGADIVTLAELAMRGRVLEVPERLFVRRFHDRTSVRANPDARSRALWFDPSRRWRAPMPIVRLSAELVRAVARSPLDLVTRGRCAAVVARRWGAPRWRDMAGELRRALVVPRSG
jgi:glycosyltransferase involved in cell wall biosynthesis